MQRMILVYTLADPQSIAEALDAMQRTFSESMLIAQREYGFDMDEGKISAILTFANKNDCDTFYSGKEMINLHYEMPETVAEEKIDYYVE